MTDHPYTDELTMDNGTVSVSLDTRDGTLTVWADQDPDSADWAELGEILRALNAPPLGVCDYEDELDVWEVRVAPGLVLPDEALTAAR
jgi:hypothetical protein